MKPETRFRVNTVDPFLKTLKNTYSMSVQQVAIHGDPDKLLCCWGRFVALELKKSIDESPRKLQVFKLGELERCGALSLVVAPENWNEVKQELSAMDKTKERAWISRASKLPSQTWRKSIQC